MGAQAQIPADRHSTQGSTAPLRMKEPAVKAHWPGCSGLWRKQTQSAGPAMNDNCFSHIDLQKTWRVVPARKQSQWPRPSRLKARTGRAKQSQFGRAAAGKSEMRSSKSETQMAQTSKPIPGRSRQTKPISPVVCPGLPNAHPHRTPYGPGSSPGQAPPAKAGVTTSGADGAKQSQFASARRSRQVAGGPSAPLGVTRARTLGHEMWPHGRES